MKKILKPIIQCSFIAASVALFGGCVVTPQPVQRKAIFVETEYAPYDLPGTSVITGQAFLKTRGGDVKYGAGNKVYLHPVTSYSTEWYEIYYVKQKPLTPHDPRIEKYSRETIADGGGNFRFSNLPAGEYYLMCQISWEVPTRYGPVQSGGIAHARVKVGAGEEVKVVVTR